MNNKVEYVDVVQNIPTNEAMFEEWYNGEFRHKDYDSTYLGFKTFLNIGWQAGYRQCLVDYSIALEKCVAQQRGDVIEDTSTYYY